MFRLLLRFPYIHTFPYYFRVSTPPPKKKNLYSLYKKTAATKLCSDQTPYEPHTQRRKYENDNCSMRE